MILQQAFSLRLDVERDLPPLGSSDDVGDLDCQGK
jgi:hypothetical protein